MIFSICHKLVIGTAVIGVALLATRRALCLSRFVLIPCCDCCGTVEPGSQVPNQPLRRSFSVDSKVVNGVFMQETFKA